MRIWIQTTGINRTRGKSASQISDFPQALFLPVHIGAQLLVLLLIQFVVQRRAAWDAAFVFVFHSLTLLLNILKFEISAQV